LELPDIHLKLDRSVEFGLKFGELLITATARNKKTGDFIDDSDHMFNVQEEFEEEIQK
ncbi:16746_t:CDS:2, partial [Dentiscutata erythropus]